MELKCVQCQKILKKENDDAYQFIQYIAIYVEKSIGQVNLDSQIFCSDQCLMNYLSFLEDSITGKNIERGHDVLEM